MNVSSYLYSVGRLAAWFWCHGSERVDRGSGAEQRRIKRENDLDLVVVVFIVPTDVTISA